MLGLAAHSGAVALVGVALLGLIGCSKDAGSGEKGIPNSVTSPAATPEFRTAYELWQVVNDDFRCKNREEMIAGQWSMEYDNYPKDSFSCGRVDPEVDLIAEGLVGIVSDSRAAALEDLCVMPEDYLKANNLRARARSTPLIVGENWVIAPAYAQEPWPRDFKPSRFARGHNATLTTVGQACPGW